jgi:hypothetical protein
MGFATFQASMSTLPKQSFKQRLPQWRHTLRSFSLDCSRTVSPRPLPSRRSNRLVDQEARKRAALVVGPISRPQGFFPQPNPLLHLDVSAELQLDAPLGFVP